MKTAKDWMQVIAVATLGTSLVIIVAGLMGLVLQLHDGEQTLALQGDLRWMGFALIGGLAAVAGIPHIFGGAQPPQPPQAPPTPSGGALP